MGQERSVDAGSLLREKVRTFSVAPQGAPDRDTDLVVFVPPGGEIGAGFEHCRKLLPSGRAVRFVADGATLAATWPAWVSSTDLILTELGAYAAIDLARSTDRLRADLFAWLDEIFDGAVPGLPGRLFYGSLAWRLLQPVLDTYPILWGLAELHGRAVLSCSDPSWPGLAQLRHLVGRSGGRVDPRPGRRRGTWPGALLAFTGAGLAAMIVDQVRWFARAAPSRKRLRELRDTGPAEPPSIWTVLTPDWMRINRHVIEAVVDPELRSGSTPGVLLFGNLTPGLRSEVDMRAHQKTDALWPGLGERLGAAIWSCPVDQIVGAESVADFVKLLVTTSLTSLRLARRLAGSGRVARGAFHFALEGHAVSIAKVLTQDLFRARASAAATEAAVARHDFDGAIVVWSGSSAYAPEAVSDLILQRAGATTVDFFHGSADCTWIGASQSQSSVRYLWTLADVEAARGFGQAVVATGMPRTVSPRPARRARPSRVLILSNYTHRESGVDGRLPLEPFQTELLSVVGAIRARMGDRFTFRWRPHPADSGPSIERARAPIPGLEVSRGVSLDEDVGWSDLIVASLSTATIEALSAGVPIFLQVLPIYRESPTVRCFAPARRFFHGRQIVDPFVACVAQLDAEDPAAIEPERHTREALLGAIEPIPFVEALRRRARPA